MPVQRTDVVAAAANAPAAGTAAAGGARCLNFIGGSECMWFCVRVDFAAPKKDKRIPFSMLHAL